MTCWHLKAINDCEQDTKKIRDLLRKQSFGELDKKEYRKCLSQNEKAKRLYILVHRQDCKGKDCFFEIKEELEKRWKQQ